MMTIVIRFCWQESLPSFYYCECDASYSLIIANVITISFPNNLATVFPSYMYDIIPSIFFKHIAIDQFQNLEKLFLFRSRTLVLLLFPKPLYSPPKYWIPPRFL